jgi:hypothetical protein
MVQLVQKETFIFEVTGGAISSWYSSLGSNYNSVGTGELYILNPWQQRVKRAETHNRIGLAR